MGALGDRYRKFYRTLNNAKKTIQFNIQFKKISTLFIQNFIHLKSSQNIHSKNYSFKFSSKYSFKILFIKNPAKIFIQKFIHSKFSPFKKIFIENLGQPSKQKTRLLGKTFPNL